MAVDGVNKVRKDGAYKLPEPLGSKLEGELLAAWVNDRGNIELKRVDRDGGGE